MVTRWKGCQPCSCKYLPEELHTYTCPRRRCCFLFFCFALLFFGVLPVANLAVYDGVRTYRDNWLGEISRLAKGGIVDPPSGEPPPPRALPNTHDAS